MEANWKMALSSINICFKICNICLEITYFEQYSVLNKLEIPENTGHFL